jgi:PQQ enzyme repeat
MTDLTVGISDPVTWGEPEQVNPKNILVEVTACRWTKISTPRSWQRSRQGMGRWRHLLRLNNRGVALRKDNVISIALDGRMFAINKATGEVVWETPRFRLRRWSSATWQSSAPPVANSASAASSRRPTSLPGAGEPVRSAAIWRLRLLRASR